jgi:hypothetical protein
MAKFEIDLKANQNGAKKNLERVGSILAVVAAAHLILKENPNAEKYGQLTAAKTAGQEA